MVQIDGLDRLLREHPFFADMDAKSHKVVAGCAANERVEAGAYLFREGQAADKFYLIRSGAVAIEMHVPGRAPMVLDTVHDGEVMGWSWIVPPYRWTFDARALELTRVVSLDATCLRKKMQKDHRLGFDLMTRFIPVMGQRLAATRLRLIDMYGNPAEASVPPVPEKPAAEPDKKAKKEKKAKKGKKGKKS